MEKLERFLMPIVISVGLLAFLMAGIGADSVVVIARIVGIFLAIVLASGFVVRWILKFRRGQRELEELRLEYEQLLAEQAAAEAAALTSSENAEHA